MHKEDGSVEYVMPKRGCNRHKPFEFVPYHKTLQCPVMWYSDYYVVLQGYNESEKGNLPHSGGWADQPAHLMALIAVVQAEAAAIRKAKNGKR